MSQLVANKPAIIGSDLNFDLLKVQTNTSTAELLDTFLSESTIPTINNPTRIAHTTATLIDNLFVKHTHSLKLHSGIIISDISYHLPVFCFLYINYTNPKRKKRHPVLSPLNLDQLHKKEYIHFPIH